MTHLRKTIVVLSLTALLALVAAGCGGGGGGGSTSTSTATEVPAALSKAELISQGEGICGEVNAAVGSVGSSAADPISQGTQVANLYINMVESLKNLGAPAEKSPQYDEFIAAAEELSKVESEIKLAAEREDSAALGEAATAATPILESFQSTAGAYGFEKCSEGPSAPTGAPSGSEGGEGEEGGVEASPEAEEEVLPEEVAPEEEAPETGGAGGGIEEEAAPPAEEGGGGSSGGVGPG
jgi:hypothetical protein